MGSFVDTSRMLLSTNVKIYMLTHNSNINSDVRWNINSDIKLNTHSHINSNINSNKNWPKTQNWTQIQIRM